MAKKKRIGSHIFWRNGRAYGDFRDYADVGGGREALAIPGSTWGTTDEVTVKTLFDNRLARSCLVIRYASSLTAVSSRST